MQETLLEAAAFFGPEAVAKCASLTVRKLYQREYHFFSPSGEGGQDVFVFVSREACSVRRQPAFRPVQHLVPASHETPVQQLRTRDCQLC